MSEPTDSKESIRIVRLGECNCFLDSTSSQLTAPFLHFLMLSQIRRKQSLNSINLRTILRLHPHFIKHRELDSLLRQRLHDLLHRVQLAHIGIRHDAHLLRAQVLQVHPDLLGRAGTEPDARRRHLEGVLLLAGRVDGGREVPPDMVQRLLLLVMVVARVGVAGAGGRVGELHGAEEVEGPGGGGGGYPDRGGYGCHCCCRT